MMVHERIVEEAVKDSRITSLVNVPFEELYGYDTNMGADESPFDIDSEIKLIGKEKLVQEKHDDVVETTQIGFEEADDDDSKNVKELLVADEVVANNVIDELVDMENTQMLT
nr:hypothetical protein [Tanacetum cinerariifolium]